MKNFKSSKTHKMFADVTVLKLFNYFMLVLCLSYGVFLYGGYGDNNWWNDRARLHFKNASLEPFVGKRNASPSDEKGLEQFRGDIERTGFFDVSISLKLKRSHLNVVKNIGIHSASKSSPIAIGNDFILSTDLGQLARVNPANEVLWGFRTTKAKEGFHSTPVFIDGQIIAGDYSGLVMSLNAKTGDMIWGLPVGHTIGASPLVTPDKKILISVETFAPDGFIAKVDLATGKIDWISPYLGDQGHSSIALKWNSENPEQSILVFGDNSSHVSAVDYNTGDFLWRQKLGGPVKATPAILGDVAVVSSWDGFLYAFDIGSGLKLWQKEFSKNNQSSAALLAEHDLGFIMSREGLCRFSINKDPQKVKCRLEPTDAGPRKSSPIITRASRSEVASGYIIWTPCKTQSICAYDLHLRLLKEWDAGAPISGELRPYQKGVMAMSEGPPGLILLTSQ